MSLVPQHVRVCIIGGGTAGLGAAHQLLCAGVKDILLLEAQDRLGGRVDCKPHGSHILEFGAHWIHGEDENIVNDIACELGEQYEEVTLKQSGIGATKFIREDGSVVDDDVVENFQIVAARLLEEAQNEGYSKRPDSESVGDYYLREFPKVNKWGTLGDELMNWDGRFKSIHDGSGCWFCTSAKGQLHYKDCDGNLVGNWKKGYITLINYLKKSLEQSQLYLSCPVDIIEWDVAVPHSKSCCKIITRTGRTILADHVIYTPSLAYLKKNHATTFVPQLPQEKISAIENLGIDVVDKVFLQFSAPWWEAGCDGFSFLVKQPLTQQQYNEKNWELGFLGFYEVFGQPDMLCGWIAGQPARAMERCSVSEVGRRCAARMRALLGHMYDISDPIWCNRSNWGSNAFILGSYSFRSLKTECSGVSPAQLASPLTNSHNIPLVCFAGEATHDYFYSTVHGALQTGRREANRLLPIIKR